MKTPKLKVITNEREHAEALKVIEGLWDAKSGSDDFDTLEVLVLLVETYEEKTFPMDPPDPVDAILFRMEQADLKPKDIVPIIGSKSRVSEVLNRKRPLTLPMIRSLHDKLHIPLESLIAVSIQKRKREHRRTSPRARIRRHAATG